MTFCVGSSLLLWNGQDTLVHFGEGSGMTIQLLIEMSFLCHPI